MRLWPLSSPSVIAGAVLPTTTEDGKILGVQAVVGRDPDRDDVTPITVAGNGQVETRSRFGKERGAVEPLVREPDLSWRPGFVGSLSGSDAIAEAVSVSPVVGLAGVSSGELIDGDRFGLPV